MTSNTEDLTNRVISPHKFTPMPGVHKCVDAEKPAVHGSCLRNTRARLVFPVTTGVRPAEDKDKIYSHNPALRAAEEVIAALNG